MSEDDQEQGNAPDPVRTRGFFQKIADARLLLGILFAAIVLLVVTGQLAALPALLLFALMLVATGIVYAEERIEPLRLARRSPPSVWPETGVKRMADALPESCIILDRRGVVRYANRHAEAAFPIRPGDPLTLRLRAPEFVRTFERVAAGGPAERIEFLERVPTERWYRASFSRMDPKDDASRPGFIVLIISDFTEQRRSEKIRVDFVANASHELRTPLASLAGFIETLQGPARDDTKARERFLAIMHDQATRMSRLIDDLLSLSRIEMKAHMRPDSPVDVVAIVRGVVDALEPQAQGQSVQIETVLPATPLLVAGDRDELVQVFQNLVENACKYGRSGGRVVVEAKASADGGLVGVGVRDFGPGISAEHLPRLTERFYRANDGTGAQRGTGLGLAIVKHILNRHRARLNIESRPGEGALFKVEFPTFTTADKPLPSAISAASTDT
ncbi:two-component system phosphate regulon sensor histidine kinase PhoR [Kaistia hirudinis]|uniref:histidine kinase n=1 Tax=Kaistia hirudinis TaxID=1293440 RepID=A0A840AWW2_9HYPH|nr:ATP-binding protein [Kaistia hirudinis]MBB3933628.1 two-component system phosphate regulon sensor histidine kinase PhoR [Kaistia hirudinis]